MSGQRLCFSVSGQEIQCTSENLNNRSVILRREIEKRKKLKIYFSYIIETFFYWQKEHVLRVGWVYIDRSEVDIFPLRFPEDSTEI